MRLRAALALAAVLVLSGCRPREITSLERKEAANMLSEAQFAVTIKDWARAEGLFAKAGELCPDQGDTWINLGVVRMRLHNPNGARSAYKSALAALEQECKRDPANSVPLIRRVSVLVILGRSDEARNLVARAYAKYPEDRRLRNFVEINGVDKMLADPKLKEVSP